MNKLTVRERNSLHDALKTFNHMYSKKIKTFDNIKKVRLNLKKLKSLKLKNFAYHRIAPNIVSAESAYPPHDRPRGWADVLSVKYHINILRENPELHDAPLPVILFINKRYVLLDGVHRIIAATILNMYHIPAILVIM